MLRSVRPALVLLLGALAIDGAVLTLAPPTQAAAASPSAVSIVGSDASDFSFDSFDSQYELQLDADGRSTLKTVETIVARFPEIDQNHGIRRAIPTRYQGHPTDIAIDSVTDENGAPRSFDTETTSEDRDQEFLDVTIAADEFVHGAQTYVITYEQSNVTLYPSDANTEEFYWDVNGTGWDQTFGLVTATVRFDPELVDRRRGQALCFQGPEGSSTPCEDIRLGGSSTQPAVSVLATNLGARENLTVVVPFEPGTFVPRDDSFTANALPIVGLVGALVSLLTALVAGLLRATRWRSAAGRFTIIAEYLPPRGVNLLTSGDVTGTASKAMAAQFISFAVRGNVRILEAGDKKSHFLLEFVHAHGVDETESRILGKLFPGLQAGDQRDLKKKSISLSKALQKERLAARAESLRLGLREKKNDGLRVWLFVLAVVGAGVALAGSLGAVITVVGGLWPLLFIAVAIISALGTFVFAGNLRPLTDSGAELRDYLKGVKLYIGLAEADRLRVLQSPEGAVRSVYRPENSRPELTQRPETADAASVQIVKLYERVLPLAVLFGQEKDWSGVLSQYYAQSHTQPDWYSGSGIFQAAYFAGAISTFSTATSASWSGSATSSSTSGGGGGGGFSGGGGGGGGGGGV
ncbi:DUF2207 domain-containing protein [Cryobacterium sp. PH31-O1]|uniref:DUF2207 domain-containing protein n=1 Tax=Cryobacterium sp. PH31-O1 TaxID=3046306 RepID=UPI0024BAA827|nr:DUF2207 domain-containing protein [Cryobacterium sp. PH31-O1]MDJ0339471.1 DUF2207 domain-containing protein [Cryobacterium sp. PH31-O1]